MDFHGLDLNLLVAFDALMTERHVTRAAARVGVSQPAMSAALSRLRRLFNDPLFLRSAEGLLPTARARDLSEPVSQALRQIESALVLGAAFEPAQARMAFSVGLAEYPSHVLLSKLVSELQAKAPASVMNVKTFISRDSAVDLLDAGKIDLAIGVSPTQPHGRIFSQPLFDDDFVTVVRRGHPAVKGALDLKTFLSLDHVLASPEEDRHGQVDQVLAQMGLKRKVALTLPHMFTVAAVVAASDMTATLMRRVVAHSAVAEQLAIWAPPLDLPLITQSLLWHRRNDQHPAQQWLRGVVASVALQL